MPQRMLVDLGRDREVTLTRLRSHGARVVAEYPRFALVDASPGELQALRDEKLSLLGLDGGGLRVNGVPVSRDSLAGLPAELRYPPPSQEPAYHIVAFVGPVQGEWMRAIEHAGAAVVEPLAGYGLVVRGRKAEMDAVRALEFVDWTAPYPPIMKLAPNLFGVPARRLTVEGMRPERITAATIPYGEVEVTLYPGEDAAQAAAAAESLGGHVTHRARASLRVQIEPRRVAALAAVPGVRRIDSWMPDEYDNDVAATILHVDVVRTSRDLDGEGQIVAVMDSGLDTGVDDATLHADFQGRVAALVPLAGRLNAIDTEAHGTHVSGSVLGDGSASAGQYAGMAPAARVVMLAKPASLGAAADLSDAFDEAYARNARLQNNSWGKGSDSAYDVYTTTVDQYVWEHRDFLPLFSAGNSGRDLEPDGVANLDSLRRTGAAKNCLCVGGCENDRPPGSVPTPGRDTTYGAYYGGETLINPIASDHFSDDPDGIFYHSARGPSDDGRIKPDVVAPATNVLSTRSSAAGDPAPDGEELAAADPLNPTYLWMTGTSMSTPLVTGCAALVRQYLVQQRGHEVVGDHPRPSAALLKAIIINGATNLPGQYAPSEAAAIPNNDEGWGRVHLEEAMFPASTARVQFSDAPEYAMQTGESREFHVHVHDPSQPFRVTLVWTDPPGAGVINQLYLRVEDPFGAFTDGDYDSNGSVNAYTGVGVNGVQNNVQQVTIAAPAAGEYTIHVIAVSVAQGMDPSPRSDLPPGTPVQDFALAVLNATGYSKQPVAVMQVVDRSGSMGYYGYIEPAKLRAQQMVDVLQINDKGGVVSFNQAPSLDHGLTLISSYGDKQALKDAITPLAASGTTSIGGGVQLAQAQFTADGLPHAMVVFSDGFSNTAPYEIDPPDGSAPVVDAAFIATGTVIHTVAVGPTADTARLEALATATSGQFFQVFGYGDLHRLHEIYYNIQALASGDEIVELDSDEAGAGDTNSHYADIDADAGEAFFGVSSDDDDDGLVLTLVDPYGNAYAPGTPRAIYREGASYRFYRVARPAAGRWTLRVQKPAHPWPRTDALGARAAAAVHAKTRYTYAVLSDSAIRMEVKLLGRPVVGKELQLSVSLTRAGVALPAAVVRAQVVRAAMPVDRLLRRYARQLDAIQLSPDAPPHHDPDRVRLALLDRQFAEQGKESVFTPRVQHLALRPGRARGVYTVRIPRSTGAEAFSVRVLATGSAGRDPATRFRRQAVLGVNIAAGPARERAFDIKDVYIVPQRQALPVASRPASPKEKVLVVKLVDAAGLPVTPRDGATVAGTLVLGDGRHVEIEDLGYSPRMGAYAVPVPNVRGALEVTLRVARGEMVKTHTRTVQLG